MSETEHKGATAKPAEEAARWYDLSLVQAVIAAVVLALIVTALSISIYASSNNHKYDINRPGSKYNSPQLSINGNTAIDSTSPVTPQTIKDTDKMITDQLKKLSPYSNYSDPGLTNDTLGLTPQQ